jgi:hypothetical protein
MQCFIDATHPAFTNSFIKAKASGENFTDHWINSHRFVPGWAI